MSPHRPGTGIPLSTSGTERPNFHLVKPWMSDPTSQTKLQVRTKGQSRNLSSPSYEPVPSGSSFHWLGKLVDHWGLEGKSLVVLYIKHMSRHKSNFQPEGKWLRKNWRQLSSGWWQSMASTQGTEPGRMQETPVSPWALDLISQEWDWCVPKVITPNSNI